MLLRWAAYPSVLPFDLALHFSVIGELRQRFDASFRVLPDWGLTRMTQRVFIDFPPSESTDVASYSLYYVPSPGPVSKDDPFVDLGLPDPVDGLISVEISAIQAFQNVDGIYELGLAAVDDVGNISENLTVASDVPLDFVAPAAPVSITVRFG